MRAKNVIILTLIVFLSAVLRFYQLGSVPPSLDWDEASIGWNAYSLLTTGTDEYGKPLPVSIRSFNDYKPPLYVYATIPSIAVFGLSEFAVRFPSALAGVLIVIITYFLAKSLLGHLPDRQAGWVTASLASFLVAVSPWALQFSRAAFEANLALLFFVAGTLFMVYYLQRFSICYLLSAIFLFILSIYSYHSSRLVVPLFLAGIFIYYRKVFLARWKLTAICFLLTALLLYPLARNAWHTGSLEARLTEVSAFAGKKVTEIPAVFVQNYLSHANFNFLFLSADGNPRHHAPDSGLLYLFQAPFLLAGFFFLARNRSQWWPIVILWLLSAPAASALARNAPHAVRALILLPVLQIITAHGVIEFLRKIGLFLRCLFCLILSVSVFYFLHQYFIHLPKELASGWQYGYKQAVQKVVAIEKNFDKVYVTNRYDQPYIYFLFYGRISPIIKNTGYFYQDFDHYKFGDFSKASKKDLIVLAPDEKTSALEVFDTVNFPDGQPAFFFARIK